MSQKILFYSRDEKYGWLSNFYRATQIVHNKEYPTNEHFFQSSKALEPEVAEWIRKAPKPFLAMKAGRSLRSYELVADWDTVKFMIMQDGLYAKFSQNHDLAKLLISTGNSILHENSPTDMIWGIKGQDMLGKLLMQVREIMKIAES